jgi:urea transport system permease protein
MSAFPLTRALDRGSSTFLLLLLALTLAVPYANLMLEPTSPFYLSAYWITLLGKYICYALLALAIDLIWGYCGILSLGHGAFFALGGYAMGMYLMRQIGTRGVYAHPFLPDFMVFLNWQELPVFWYGFNHFWYAAAMVVVVPGVLAFVFGWFAFRSRVTGVYLSIITQALTFALLLGFFRNNFGFGGNNGLTDFKDILGFNVQAPTTRAALFVASMIALIVGFLICRAIVASKLGKILIAIRDAEARTRFLGYRVESYKLFVFTLSACMAGVAGALYVPQVGIINPSEFSPGNSIEAVIWVAVGGRGTLVGAVLGAVLVNAAKTTFTSGNAFSYWVIGLIALAALMGAAIAKRQWLVIGSAVIGVAAAWAGALILAPLVPNWPFLLAFVLIPVAMATGWHGLPLGALFGALLYGLFASPYSAVALAPYWLFLLGGLFVAVTLLLPRGIVGIIVDVVGIIQHISGLIFKSRASTRDRAPADTVGSRQAEAAMPEPAPRPAE